MAFNVIYKRIVLAYMVICFVSANLTANDQLRYGLKPGTKYAYRYNITVDGSSSKTHYKGMTSYTVATGSEKKNAPDQMRLRYYGGLSESKTYKSRSGIGGPFGPRFPSIRHPFSEPTFRGKIPGTVNQLTLTTRGGFVAMEGTSHLPYLLGNVSLIPFELLPEDGKAKWTSGAGVSVTQEDDNSFGRFGPRIPFGPFGSGNNKTVQSAAEMTRYKVEKEEGDLITVSKMYQFSMPPDKDKTSYDMTGAGTWVFDTKAQCPHSSEMEYKFIIKEGNVTTTLPISLKFERVSTAELAKMDAEAKRKAEEKKMAEAKAKAEAERPLTDQEKSDFLTALASDESSQVVDALKQLAKKSVKEPDAEVAKAIREHLESDDKNIAKEVKNALAKWSPDYKKIRDLEKAYASFFNVKSTGREVTSQTPLYVGQIVQVNQHGPWWKAGVIKELKDDGKVAIQMRGGSRRVTTFARRQIQLAPEALPQPSKPKTPVVATTSVRRTWTDATGVFKFEATFVKMGSGKVTLKGTDDREVTLELDKLSAEDQKFLSELNSKNPFAAAK